MSKWRPGEEREAEKEERRIKRERRAALEVKCQEKREKRELKKRAKESYDSKHGGSYGMKLSHCQPNLNCRGCGQPIPEHWVAGRGPVCSDCLPLFDVEEPAKTGSEQLSLALPE